MSTSAGRVKSLVCLTKKVNRRARALAPVSPSGPNGGKRSLSLLLGEVAEIGDMARVLVPEGELPWPAIRALVQAEVERKAPRRVRT